MIFLSCITHVDERGSVRACLNTLSLFKPRSHAARGGGTLDPLAAVLLELPSHDKSRPYLGK